ncbi:MAG TPA: penicillin-binding protein 2 [Microthrixaceae bacterium]|nr:penicillin-binding protein 2 [Microthrixaceae bacterium]
MDTDSGHVRLSAIGIVAISLFLALFMRLWFLQGIDRQQFEAVSESNRLRVVHEEGPRGRILDRNGKVLVDNKTSIVVSLDREPLKKLDEKDREKVFIDLADTLSNLGVPTKVSLVKKRYNDTRYAPQDYVPVRENVDQSVEIYLVERSNRFPGVVVERKAIRTYPYGSTAVHILGYVSEINEKELAARGWDPTSSSTSTSTTEAPPNPDGASNDGDSRETTPKDYRPGDTIGRSGVERAYEDDLRAVPGQRTIEVNARGDLVDVVSVDPPEPGDDLWLSIDVDLQAHAERLLAAKIEALRGGQDKVGNRLNAPQGSVVIEDPKNGQILAMASYPNYDPATTVNGISQEQWDAFNDPNSGYPLNNWAIGGTYAPGSTFKLFSAFAGLRTGFLEGPNGTMVDNGVYKIENCKSGKCEVQNAGRTRHGTVNLPRALTVSSDVYFYRLADKFWNLRGEFGEAPIQDAAAEFGLGKKSGIPLVGENRGRLPTPAALREAYAAQPDKFLTGDWRSGDNINMSIGQGDVSATPLQIANAYSTFANGGTLYQPQVAVKVTRAKDATKAPGDASNFDVVRDIKAVPKGTVEFVGDQWGKIYSGLLGVTQERGGTAYSSWKASPTSWPMAGKTGTAQVAKKADSALFVGWGPAIPGVPPEYAISVVIPEAGFGGEVAAPLAFRILAPVSFGQLAPACPVADQTACASAAQAALDAAQHDVVSGGQD